MILWLTGNTGAGKTTLGKALARGSQTVLLDGDAMRRTITTECGFSKEDRVNNCLRIARLAKHLEDQGFGVVVSVIAPYEDLRAMIKEMTNCVFVWLPGGKRSTEETPYEPCDKTADLRLEDWDVFY